MNPLALDATSKHHTECQSCLLGMFHNLGMIMALPCLSVLCDSDMVIMGLKRFSNQELTDVIKAAGTLQFDDDMLLDRTSQQLMLSVHKMSADELFNLVYCHPVHLHMCLAVSILTLLILVGLWMWIQHQVLGQVHPRASSAVRVPTCFALIACCTHITTVMSMEQVDRLCPYCHVLTCLLICQHNLSTLSSIEMSKCLFQFRYVIATLAM